MPLDVARAATSSSPRRQVRWAHMDRRLRICVVSSYYPPNFISGGTLQPQRLARGLLARGHDVEVFAGWKGLDRPPLSVFTETDEVGLPVHWIDISEFSDWSDPRNYTNPPVRDAFVRFLDRFAPDVVHFHPLQSFGASLVRAAKDAGAATVVTMHDFWWWCARQFLVDRGFRPCNLVVEAGACECEVDRPFLEHRNEVLASLLPHADLVLAPSPSAAAVFAANGVDPARLEVDENGLPDAGPTPTVARVPCAGPAGPIPVHRRHAGDEGQSRPGGGGEAAEARAGLAGPHLRHGRLHGPPRWPRLRRGAGGAGTVRPGPARRCDGRGGRAARAVGHAGVVLHRHPRGPSAGAAGPVHRQPRSRGGRGRRRERHGRPLGRSWGSGRRHAPPRRGSRPAGSPDRGGAGRPHRGPHDRRPGRGARAADAPPGRLPGHAGRRPRASHLARASRCPHLVCAATNPSGGCCSSLASMALRCATGRSCQPRRSVSTVWRARCCTTAAATCRRPRPGPTRWWCTGPRHPRSWSR